MPEAAEFKDPPRDAASFFEFDLPEHLPSSPMCPANPKYRGSSKACVVS